MNNNLRSPILHCTGTGRFLLSSRRLDEMDGPMTKVNDDLKHLACTLADWAADKSVTVFEAGLRLESKLHGPLVETPVRRTWHVLDRQSLTKG
jgi:hypothetical protein